MIGQLALIEQAMDARTLAQLASMELRARAIVEGHLRLLDPVGDNDFWLRRPFRRKQP